MIPCTEPPSSKILSQVSLLFIFNFLNTFSNSGFFLIKVPLEVCSVNTFAAQGSIPGDELPANFELDTVGATALRCVFLNPVSLHQSGSPYSDAKNYSNNY